MLPTHLVVLNCVVPGHRPCGTDGTCGLQPTFFHMVRGSPIGPTYSCWKVFSLAGVPSACVTRAKNVGRGRRNGCKIPILCMTRISTVGCEYDHVGQRSRSRTENAATPAASQNKACLPTPYKIKDIASIVGELQQAQSHILVGHPKKTCPPGVRTIGGCQACELAIPT